jgi:hypothetical protein
VALRGVRVRANRANAHVTPVVAANANPSMFAAAETIGIPMTAATSPAVVKPTKSSRPAS